MRISTKKPANTNLASSLPRQAPDKFVSGDQAGNLVSSMAWMYITLFILLGALNSNVTVMDVPVLVRLEIFVGWQLVAEYSGWQYT
jgi:hypothetical protein